MSCELTGPAAREFWNCDITMDDDSDSFVVGLR
ncbi:MAG: hypothetical protein QOK23_3607 [Gammaproteobacteria bacterium]|nr:hypothetical protein [Gammaproteobacteria bacterium]